MKRAFFINIVFLILANLLIKPFYLLWVEVEVNNIVGPSTYGLYAGIFSMCYILQIIADPGLLNFNTTQISSDRNLVYSRVPTMLGLKISLAIVYILIVFLVGFLSGYGAEQWLLLPWIMTNVLFVSMNLYLRSNITGIGKYRWDSFFSVLDKSLMIIILVYMIYYSPHKADFTILDFIQGQIMAYAISFVFLLIFTVVQKISIVPKFDFSSFAVIIKQSLPYAWLLFLMTIYTRIDTFMLERLVNDHGYQAGVYASSFRLFDAGNSFAYLFAVLLLPIFSTMLSKKQSITTLLASASSLLFTGTLIICVFSGFWATEIMSFFYPNDFTPQYSLVFIALLFALIPMAIAYITGSLLTADHKLKFLNKIAVLGVFINVILNLVLIHHFQSIGAAIATAITQISMTLFQIFFILKTFRLTIKTKDVIKFASLIIISFLLAIMAKFFSPLESWVNFALGIIISTIFAFFIGLVQLDFFKSALKNKLTT